MGPADIDTTFALEHRALLVSATALIADLKEFRGRLRPDAGVAHAQHFDFAERALALSLYLGPALDLAFTGDYLPAFAVLRGALEHHLTDRLLFLADRYKRVFTEVKKATYEHLEADRKSKKPGTEGIVKLEWKDGTVVMIRTGLHPSEPRPGAARSTISIYYFLLQEFDPFVGHPKQQPYLAREFTSVKQHTEHAQEQQVLYRQNLSWEQIKSNLVYNRRCTVQTVRRFEVHYQFLSAFVHSVPAGLKLVYGRNRPTVAPRYDHYASELVLLYINKIASEELKVLERMTRRAPPVGLTDWPSVEAHIKTADAVAAHLWFPGDRPHQFDYVAEANSRALRGDKPVPMNRRPTPAQLKEAQIRYYRNPLRRLIGTHQSFFEYTGFAYESPWPREDARFR